MIELIIAATLGGAVGGWVYARLRRGRHWSELQAAYLEGKREGIAQAAAQDMACRCLLARKGVRR